MNEHVEGHERRISTVEANIKNMSESSDRMLNYMEQMFNSQHGVNVTLALVVQNQEEMKLYQKRCDTDRADHEKRITSTEGFQKRLVRCAIAVTGIGSLVSPQLSKVWEKLTALAS